MDVFLNGRIVSPDQAMIRSNDAGFLHGVGLFETMAAVNGKVFRLKQHLERLAVSARELGLSPRLETEPLGEAVNRTLEHNSVDAARVRLTITAGPLATPGAAQASTGTPAEPTVLIAPTEPTVYDPKYFEQGIMALIAPPAANPFDQTAGHKTLNYWPRLRTLRQAAAAGAGEAIWLSVTNHLASGAVSNIFLVKDGELLTPIARGEEEPGALGAPVLPGITRAVVMELAEGMGLSVNRRMLSVEDLLDADEVFLTNSSWHVLPVTQVEKKPIADGTVGELTGQLREKLLATIDSETGS